MSTRLRGVLFRELGELRCEPIDKRIRAVLDGETVVDGLRAQLGWEPRRAVPAHAVPLADVRGGRAAEVTGCYAFFTERVDLVIDGRRLQRPTTPWS